MYKREDENMKNIFLILVLSIILLGGCTKGASSEITGDVVSNTAIQAAPQPAQIQETAQPIQEDQDKQAQLEQQKLEDQKKAELLEKKKQALSMVTSASYDKIEVSLLLNEINDVKMISAWNALQRCINCKEYSTLKQNFITVTQESIAHSQ